MARYSLVWINDDGWRLSHDDEYVKRLSLETKSADDATLEDLAEFCDSEAENANYHNLVGAHEIVAAALLKAGGREKATEMMRVIAEFGGLAEITDESDIWKALGVKKTKRGFTVTDKKKLE